jgi:drug/metabolite transporter (DMT)-like permease
MSGKMAPMTMNRIFGIVAFAIGVALLIFAYHSTNAPLEKLSNTITGRYSNETMWYFGVGIVAVVGGGLMAMFGSRK